MRVPRPPPALPPAPKCRRECTTLTVPSRPRRVSIGEARLAAHAAKLAKDQAEARAARAAEAAAKSSQPPRPTVAPEDGFVWPALGTKLPPSRRQNTRHWRESLAEPEPLL